MKKIRETLTMYSRKKIWEEEFNSPQEADQRYREILNTKKYDDCIDYIKKGKKYVISWIELL